MAGISGANADKPAATSNLSDTIAGGVASTAGRLDALQQRMKGKPKPETPVSIGIRG